MSLPRIALTLGDVAGIGPEIVARACVNPEVRNICQPIVIGCPAVFRRAMVLIGTDNPIAEIDRLQDAVNTDSLPVFNSSSVNVADIPPGAHNARSGRAAYDYLIAATQAALRKEIDAIVTAPLSKAGLHAAGLSYPGHTEILAEQCGVNQFAMMLYLPEVRMLSSEPNDVHSSNGLAVNHVTLHTSIASVPGLLTTEGISDKIELLYQFLSDIGIEEPRLAVCALNPHAGEEGLFGDQEHHLIAPAICQHDKMPGTITGPLPADTVFRRAAYGEFDGVVAMYHDQGHIALKLLGEHRAINVTLGLPIVRTSPSHGTAYDIAWQGIANSDGLYDAIAVAAKLAEQ